MSDRMNQKLATKESSVAYAPAGGVQILDRLGLRALNLCAGATCRILRGLRARRGGANLGPTWPSSLELVCGRDLRTRMSDRMNQKLATKESSVAYAPAGGGANLGPTWPSSLELVCGRDLRTRMSDRMNQKLATKESSVAYAPAGGGANLGPTWPSSLELVCGRDLRTRMSDRMNQKLATNTWPADAGLCLEDVEASKLVAFWSSHKKILMTAQEKCLLGASLGRRMFSRNYGAASAPKGQKIKVPLTMIGVSGNYASALNIAAVKANVVDKVESELYTLVEA
ncbi:Uncharacterized protein Fot_29621 [Forsythia ovata]|uniref:Uncharacterized protein n=1 Tax=Forsythia ovata TaxID=205694 RepID=A0ABD1TSE2_9LAMI